MKLKKITSVLAVSSALVLNACGGGGAAGPTQNAGYGDVVSISQQNLGVYASMKVLYPVMLQTGDFGVIKGTSFSVESAFESANIINSATTFNFNPVAPVTTNPGYFKAASVSAFAVEYKTPGQNATTNTSQISRTGSGLIIVPNGVAPRGVVVYFHPTTWGKNQVPSCLGPLASGNISSNVPAYCNVTALDSTGAGTFAMLAAVYAARGFVVVAPDYVGQGSDYDNVHPYVVFPENNALAAFNMFPAMRQILAAAPFNISSSTTLPLFITGYSEGGGYALKASQLAQTTAAGALSNASLSLKISSPQEGAYSLTDQMNFAFNNNNDGLLNCASNPSYNCGNVDMMNADQSSVTPEVSAMNTWNIGSAPYAAKIKPLLTSYVLTAATYYDFENLNGAYDMSMNHQFWADVVMPGNVVASLYQLYSGILGDVYTGSQIVAGIFENSTKINGYDPVITPHITVFSPLGDIPEVLPAGNWGTNNAGTNFIHQKIANDPQFITILADGSTYNWRTNSPINFIHMNYDSAVTVLNSHQAYSCMKNGVSFSGSGNLVASAAPCSTPSSGALIESTIIPNFQLTNNVVQLAPMDFYNESQVNRLAKNKFWTASSFGISYLGTPFDHGDMFVQGSIVALCTFENSLKDGSNSGVCPAL